MITQNFINLMSLHGLFSTDYTKNVKKIDGTDVIIDYSTYIDLGMFSRNKKTYYDLTLDESRQYANEATFEFKQKPETAFHVLFQIKTPGI